MGTEIVWVYGNSGAGKETFMRTISEEKPFDVINRFGWADKKIIPCIESIKWIAQYKDDPRGEERKKLPAIILRLAAKTNSVVLIKGQNLDLLAGRLRETRTRLPQCRHKIIFIKTKIDEVYERLKRKPWWKKYYTKKYIRESINNQIKEIKDLQKEFEITAISGNAGENYKIVNFPHAKI